MFTIRKATTEDIPLIHKMAQEVFPATYADILSPDQLDYMMEWMYSITNLHKQMEEEGHIYYIAFKGDYLPATFPFNPKEKIYSICRRFMYSLLFKANIWESYCSSRL